MKTSLVVSLLVAMLLSVQPVKACNFDVCTADCDQQKSQCLEQLATTLDPQKQDEINAECDGNFKKCFHECTVDCTESKNIYLPIEKRQSEEVAYNFICLTPR